MNLKLKRQFIYKILQINYRMFSPPTEKKGGQSHILAANAPSIIEIPEEKKSQHSSK
jgi:hypothetical protein